MAESFGNLKDVLTPDITEYDKQIFNHTMSKAWRFDSNKWRTRGKGSITLYYNVLINKAKLIFFDEKYQKIRLLQYIDHLGDECVINTSDSECVEWYGNDYTMDSLNPLKSQWKLKFIDSCESSIEFLILYNYHISLYNKYLNNKYDFTQELSCGICYDFINEAKLLYCNHIGCNKCISEWHNQSSTCPICTVKISHPPINIKSINHIIKYRRNRRCGICQNTIDNNTYIICYYCNNWYDPQCVGLNIKQINKKKYKCPLCISKQETIHNISNLSLHSNNNEILIGEVPCKSVIYNNNNNSNKKRVIDTKLQFLQNINNGKYRLIARDNKTNKIKIDQLIYDYYRDKLQMKSNKSYEWIAMDYILQSEYNIYEQVLFIANFYTEKDANDFKLYYTNNIENNIDNKSVISESIISELSKINNDEINKNDNDNDNKHNDDPYEEWKNAAIITMKQNINIYIHNDLETHINHCIENTKLWINEMLLEEYRRYNIDKIDLQLNSLIDNIYVQINEWNGIEKDSINCFNSYWNVAVIDLDKWFGDYYFYKIIEQLKMYCNKIYNALIDDSIDLYLLQSIYCLVNNNIFTDSIIHNSKQLQLQLIEIANKYKYNNNIQWTKQNCLEWLEICIRKIKMDIIIIIYKNYSCKEWINIHINIQIGNVIKLKTGHIGKIVHIENTNQNECIYDNESDGQCICDLHKLCIHGHNGDNTTFIGIILNKIDKYYGHNGTIGCNKYFETSSHKGLLIPLPFIENCNINRENDNFLLSESEIRIGDRVQTKNGKYGYVKYIGKIANGAEITMYGIELDIDTMIYPGNDGSFNGVKYFNVTLGRGYFTTKDDLIKIVNDLQKCYDIYITNLSGHTAYNNIMEWLKKNNKLSYIKSINVYKHNGLIEGIISIKDINEQIYILNHLNGEKIGNKYVGVYTRDQYKNTVLCLNCNKNGHFIKDCPNTIALSDTIDTNNTMTIDDETYSNFVQRMTIEALQQQTDLSTPIGDINKSDISNSIFSVHPPPADVSNITGDYGDVSNIIINENKSEFEYKTDTSSNNDIERYLYSINIEKLYAWCDNDWRIRTSKSRIEFYQNKKTGKIRLVVRDPITFKLKLNHFIPSTSECILQRKPNTIKCWQWKAFDATIIREQIKYGQNNNNMQIFCAKFNSQHDGNKFYEFFINIQKNNELVSDGDNENENNNQIEDEYIITDDDDEKSLVTPKLNGDEQRVIVKIYPMGIGVILNIKKINNFKIINVRNIKTMLTTKLGIDIYKQIISNGENKNEILDDNYIITDYNQILYLKLEYNDLYQYNNYSDHSNNNKIKKLWKITTIIGQVELNIELTEEERCNFYCVNDLKKKIFSFSNIMIPQQELYIENVMLNDEQKLKDLEKHNIFLCVNLQQTEIPIFVKYKNRYIFMCLDNEKDSLSAIATILNFNNFNDLLLKCNNIIMDYEKCIKEYVNDNNLIIMNAFDNSVLNVNVYCMYMENKMIQIKMRKCQTIGELKYEILEKYSEKDNINLDNINIFSCLNNNINNLQNLNHLEYRSIVNFLQIIYTQNDNNDLLYNFYNNTKMLFCRIKINKKIKILFPKYFGTKNRIKTFNISSFDIYLTELYEFVSNITQINFTSIMLYSPELQKHISHEWSGQQLISQHLLNGNSEYIILYFMNIPKIINEMHNPPKILNISIKINDEFYCKKYHNKIIPFMINIYDCIEKFKQEITTIFSFFGQLKLLKKSINNVNIENNFNDNDSELSEIRMDYDDSKLLSHYYLQSNDLIEISVIYPNQFEIDIKTMNGFNFQITVTPYDTIKMLKNKINSKLKGQQLNNLSIYVIKIIFLGRELDEVNQTIAQHSIRKNSTIHAVLSNTLFRH